MIIIGTVFILIAYNIVSIYMQNEQAKYDFEVKSTFRGLFNYVGITTGTEENKLALIEGIFKKKEIEIICENGFAILSINNNYDTNNNFLSNYPAYSTYIKQGKVDETYLAVENFKLPFKITNLLGIVSKRNLIILDENAQITPRLVKKFEETSYSNLDNYQIIDLSSYTISEFNSDYKYKNLDSVIILSENPPNMNLLGNIKPMAYHIRIEENQEKYAGNIIYTDKENNKFEFPYIDLDESLSMITMSLFSKPSTYKCSYNIIQQTTLQKIDFYINKTNYLINLTDHESICSDSLSQLHQKMKYEPIKDKLIEIRENIKNNNFNKQEELYSLIKTLEITHKENLEEYNCLYVY